MVSCYLYTVSEKCKGFITTHHYSSVSDTFKYLLTYLFTCVPRNSARKLPNCSTTSRFGVWKPKPINDVVHINQFIVFTSDAKLSRYKFKPQQNIFFPYSCWQTCQQNKQSGRPGLLCGVTHSENNQTSLWTYYSPYNWDRIMICAIYLAYTTIWSEFTHLGV